MSMRWSARSSTRSGSSVMSQSDSAQAEALYQELILEHYRKPRNMGTLEGATSSAKQSNPLCGDAVEVSVVVAGDVVSQAGFTGEGCSIMRATASMMTELARGKTLRELRELSRSFTRVIAGAGEPADAQALGDLSALSAIHRVPARARCAMLPWEAIEAAVGASPAA